jgi:amino acid adenylation domain-containing protein
MASAQHLIEWLDRSAVDHPERAAVEDSAGRSMSYRELAVRSRRVQSTLQSIGVSPGDRVAVCMRKSIDTVVVFHAILRCGAAYVPADPLAPASRAAYITTNCEAAAVVVDEALAAALSPAVAESGGHPRVLIVPTTPSPDHAWRVEALESGTADEPAKRNPADMAFLLYTSGSTGKPKAVILTHQNVVSFVDWCSGAFAPTPADKFATHAPLQFSLSVFNLYVAWKHGATVVLIDEQSARVPQLVAPLLEERRITIWFSTPTILSLLAQSGELPSLALDGLRLVMFAGEPFPPAQFRSLQMQLPHVRYVHILGSTETHIMACHEVPGQVPAETATPIPIGQVCPHFRGRVIDDNARDAAVGSDGELCLSGPAVTPGYWRGPDDNTRAFFLDEHGERWYRTGDIVVRRQDGVLMYRGRRDRMIKKFGNRIELAEIEACLSANADVREAAVVAVSDEERGVRVQAFVVPRNGSLPTIIQLKAHCARALPSYMVPDGIALREALPRTSTGKVDFPALKALA